MQHPLARLYARGDDQRLKSGASAAEKEDVGKYVNTGAAHPCGRVRRAGAMCRGPGNPLRLRSCCLPRKRDF
jgi:hypothetical protein